MFLAAYCYIRNISEDLLYIILNFFHIQEKKNKNFLVEIIQNLEYIGIIQIFYLYKVFHKRGLVMGSFQLFGKELSSLKNRKGLLFALIGVMFIPIVYVAILLSATCRP